MKRRQDVLLQLEWKPRTNYVRDYVSDHAARAANADISLAPPSSSFRFRPRA